MAYLDQFSKSVRIAWPSIRLGIAQGLNRTTIMKNLSLAGMGIRNKVGLAVIKTAQNAYRDPSTYLPEDITQTPIHELIPPTMTNQNKRYKIVVAGNVFNKELQEGYIKHATISSTILPSQADILEIGREVLAVESPDFGSELGEVWIDGINDSFKPIVV